MAVRNTEGDCFRAMQPSALLGEGFTMTRGMKARRCRRLEEGGFRPVKHGATLRKGERRRRLRLIGRLSNGNLRHKLRGLRNRGGRKIDIRIWKGNVLVRGGSLGYWGRNCKSGCRGNVLIGEGGGS